jgi:hypothetical protein
MGRYKLYYCDIFKMSFDTIADAMSYVSLIHDPYSWIQVIDSWTGIVVYEWIY